MENPDNLDNILDQTLKYAKKTAKEFYFKIWSKNPPKCPAFDGEVVNISHYGWEHLVYLRKRTKLDLLGRLFVLERAKKILETAQHYQSHIKRGNEEFWIFEAELDNVKVKVVVRSIEQGNKHFYSVIRKGSVDQEIKKIIKQEERIDKILKNKKSPSPTSER